MDDKTKREIAGRIIVGASISAGIGILIAIFSNQTVGSSIGQIVGWFIGGACFATRLNLRKLRSK